MIITIFFDIVQIGPHYVIKDVLGGGYTPTLSELGEKELIINTPGNIKVTISLGAPFLLFFLFKKMPIKWSTNSLSPG